MNSKITFNDKEITDSQKIKIINKVVKFKQLFDLIGTKLSGKKLKCPFHNGQSNNSATIFNNPDGEYLYCFSEEKRYRPCDLITCGIVDIDINDLFVTVWNQLTDSQKKVIMKLVSVKKENFVVNELPANFEKSRKTLKGFQKGEYTYDKFCEFLCDLASGRTV